MNKGNFQHNARLNIIQQGHIYIDSEVLFPYIHHLFKFVCR